MLDLRPLPALANRKPFASPRIGLSALPEGTVLHVIAGPKAPDQTASLERLAAETGLALRALPPGQWLLVGDRPTPHAQVRRLLAALEPHATGIDQSHGRVRMRLDGPMASTVLSKGTAVDLHLSAFPKNHTVATLIGHVSAHLTRHDTDVFEIAALRSLAGSLWDDLAGMCAEFL
ncbi:sarcosine oxidase subunit gamma family protein [Shinella sp. BYT-45]|uniref:sarcosine oxidase subunit gamma family protein n=1 Tax=Shinella sp. BYT-45 TaxID=3377377 RepID=UPI0039808F59